ncbi:MAG TPA: ATP synthase F1 subunit delta [Holosporales bacterium]|nr:ATP synthase F1 subunit delta [Holosporales bacterium]
MPASLSIGFSLPGRYAKSLIDFDSKNFLKDFDALLTVLKSNTDTVFLLKAQHLKRYYLMDFVDVISNTLKLQKEFSSFLKVLIENNRLSLLEDIARCYKTLWNKKQNIRNIDVYSAIKLSEKEKIEAEERIKSFFSEKLNIAYEVDESLLGGILIQSDGILIDASIKNHIKTLEQTIRA